MATKPTDTVPIWASNANWSTGPSAGSPTKIDPTPYAPDGHIEGVATPSRADVMNGFQNPVSKWCQWVQAGSSAGAADAHIVETDAGGQATVAGMVVDATGNGSASAMYVTNDPTLKCIYATDTVSTVIVVQNGVGVSVDGPVTGFASFVTGDNVAYVMGTQSTAPTTFATGETPLFSVRGTFSGNTSTVVSTAIEATREYIPTYEDQHVRATGYTNNVTATTSEATAIASTSWPARKVLQAETSIFATITFVYTAVSAPMTLTIRLKKGASTVDTSQFVMGNTADTAKGSHLIRVQIPFEPSGSTGGYLVTAQTSTGTIDLLNAMLTLETSE